MTTRELHPAALLLLAAFVGLSVLLIALPPAIEVVDRVKEICAVIGGAR